MPTIDYEVEYNNRARVPEHVDILARWERDAAAYRAARTDAEIGLSYGPTARQTLDIFPALGGQTHDDAPLALFVHGGWWRTLHPSSFSHMAAGPNARGVTVAVAGYNLTPQVTIAQIIDEIRAACLFLWRRYKRRFVVYGHSAGGHLAACMMATNWAVLDADAPSDLVPAGYSVSGLFDLTPLIHVSMNQDFKLTEISARLASPLYWPAPRRGTLDAIVGGAESNEFLRQSKAIAEAWNGPVHTHYAEIPGANHFTALDPLADSKSAMAARVAELARHPQGVSR